MATIRLFGLSKTSDLVYLIVVLGVISYSIGVSISRKYKIKTGLQNNSKNFYIFELKDRFVFFLVLVLLIWTGYRMVTTVIPMLRAGFPLDAVRLVYFGNEFQGYSYSRIDDIVEMFINLPFLYALMPITVIELTTSKENRELKSITIIMLLVWLVISCIISGGRVMIFLFVVLFIVAYLLNGNGKVFAERIKHKTRTSVIGIVVVSVMMIVMYQLSINRSGSGTYEFLYQIYVYFCGCMPHTSLRLETVNIDYTFGMTFFSGILRPLMLVYKYLIGNGSFPDIYQRTIDIGETLQTAVTISSGHTFNAFVLPFYYFFNDGGILAVAVESLIYGYFSGRVFINYQVAHTKREMAKYLIIVIYIATSMIRFSPSLVYFAFAYFYVDFFFSPKRTTTIKDIKK